MIIAIEGMDGVGKTTVAKSIEKDCNFKYIKDPLKELLEINQEHLEKISNKVFNFDDIRIKAWYLALGDIYALKNYKNENIIMDRHILLNYFWNGNKESEKIFETQIKLFGKPDLTILLYASPEVRMKRILNRNPNDPDLKKQGMKEYGYDKLTKFLEKYNYNYVLVNTEEKLINEVIEECKNIIEEYISKNDR